MFSLRFACVVLSLAGLLESCFEFLCRPGRVFARRIPLGFLGRISLVAFRKFLGKFLYCACDSKAVFGIECSEGSRFLLGTRFVAVKEIVSVVIISLILRYEMLNVGFYEFQN